MTLTPCCPPIAPPAGADDGPCGAKWKSIAFGVRNYVAVAYSGEVAVLDHCGKWRLLPLPFAVWQSVTYHASVFVAVSADGLSARSTDDGLTWTWGPLPGVNWRCVAGANGVLIAVAAQSGVSVARSTDLGLTWTPIPAPWQAWRTVVAGLVNVFPNGVPTLITRWVAMADEPAIPIMFSDDQGLNWQLPLIEYPHPTQPEVPLTNERSTPGRRWQSVAWGDGLFVAVGKGFARGDRTAISGDGIRWQVIAGSDRPQMFGLDGPNLGLITPGNIDLNQRPVVQTTGVRGTDFCQLNPVVQTTISTVRAITITEDGVAILIPTVSDDARIMSDAQAIATYHSSGKHLGRFDTEAHANAYAGRLHLQQQQLYGTDGYRPTVKSHWSHVTFWNHTFIAVAHLDPLSRTDRLAYMPSLSPGHWTTATLPSPLPMTCVVGGNRGLIAMADDGANGRRCFQADTPTGQPPGVWTQHVVIPCGDPGSFSFSVGDPVTRFLGGRLAI